MANRTYWLNLFTGTTWDEFLTAGANTSGFRGRRWTTVKRIKPGDYLLCYVTGISRFIGLAKVTGSPFQSEKPGPWKDADFPCRVPVKLLTTLTFETPVPIHNLRDELSIFQNLTSPHAWTGHLRGSPARWKVADGEAIVKALEEAKENPMNRPVDQKQLSRRPRALDTKIGPVTVPEGNDDDEGNVVQVPENTVLLEAPSKHTEIQFQLLKLGAEMGFNVWAARNDRNRTYGGKPFSERFKLKESLPVQFDEATVRTIEYIDVLWLKGNAIVAAFEIESTTSVYSGFLRMSDLIAMQPNLNIPLYIVAPDERRDKVFVEVNRPTFSRLSPPLVDVCRYISFEILAERLDHVASYVQYLKPEFLEELSEVCEVEE